MDDYFLLVGPTQPSSFLTIEIVHHHNTFEMSALFLLILYRYLTLYIPTAPQNQSKTYIFGANNSVDTYCSNHHHYFNLYKIIGEQIAGTVPHRLIGALAPLSPHMYSCCVAILRLSIVTSRLDSVGRSRQLS